ncbi:peroxiredoxin [Lentzea tibetensis]|uniref:thioredoxin-dependent peroxiredoxin n=1 Tax=Lentzea tibetensis TaxID=2591470 RepID=A0A563EK52_9PSEU|nr:peroxiredoxin [Lentzea tibetensis]TWP47256.1 peroxiredoxin [Lentzea tibetensis]
MKPGDLAPDFTLPDQHNQLSSLGELLSGGPVVLFFYPAAMTGGCTAETCHFRDLAAEFRAAGAQRVGISRDSVGRQHRFADTYDVGFPLLSDTDGLVAEQFGVKRRFGPLPVKRHTFVIDRDRTVLEVIKSEFNMNAHADKALEALRAHASK